MRYYVAGDLNAPSAGRVVFLCYVHSLKYIILLLLDIRGLFVCGSNYC